MFEMVMARASAIACGHKDANDLDLLRHDPLMKMAVDRCPQSRAPLASQSTISRLENAPRKTEAAQLAGALGRSGGGGAPAWSACHRLSLAPHRTADERSRTRDWRAGITRSRVAGAPGTRTCQADFSVWWPPLQANRRAPSFFGGGYAGCPGSSRTLQRPRGGVPPPRGWLLDPNHS